MTKTDVEKQPLLPLTINSKRNVLVLANDLIMARKKTNLSHTTIKTMDWLMTQIKKGDNDFKDYIITTAEFGALMNVSKNNVAREMAKVSEELMLHLCYIPKPNGWLLTNLTSSAEYTVSKANGGVLALRISEKLKPYLLKFKDNFTRLEQSLLLSFKKKHSNELYKIFLSLLRKKLIKQQELELDSLKAALGLAKLGPKGVILSTLYNKFSDFEKRVLTPSLKEINTVTDIEVSYKVTKRMMRRPVALTFTIKSKAFDKKLRNIFNQKHGELSFSGVIAEKIFQGWLEKMTIEEMEALVMVKTT